MYYGGIGMKGEGKILELLSKIGNVELLEEYRSELNKIAEDISTLYGVLGGYNYAIILRTRDYVEFRLNTCGFYMDINPDIKLNDIHNIVREKISANLNNLLADILYALYQIVKKLNDACNDVISQKTGDM